MSDYDNWYDRLSFLAEQLNLTIHVDTYHYHPLFMRGYDPSGVIDEIKENNFTQK